MKKQFLQIQDLPLENSRVLVRVDFNVPLDESGKVTDTTRIEAALPTIQALLKRKAKVILMSHLGRPIGKDPTLTLRPIAKELEKLLKQPILFAEDSIGPDVEKKVDQLKPGEVLLLENLRFHPGEEAPEKDPKFAEGLAKLGDFYINDAFGCVHRAHASVVDVPRKFPGKSAMGLLMQKEIMYLNQALENPERPFIAIIGGAKISSKIKVLLSLIEVVDTLLIGGGMAFTFLVALGYKVGQSRIEKDFLEYAIKILKEAESKKVKILLPLDVIAADQIKSEKAVTFLMETGIPETLSGFDIGELTIQSFKRAILKAKTIIWNGPMGVFEEKTFSQGTFSIAKAVIESHALTIVGGGETVSAVNSIQGHERISHISTGGGATLEFIEKRTLPGIDALLL